MAVSSAAVRQLSDGNSQGTSLGQSAADLISFYNATPVAKQVVGGSLSSGAYTSSLATALTRLGFIVNTSQVA